MTQPAKKLILLVNLGSPEGLSVGAIRNFLRQFLSDQRVVGLPKLLWYPILYGIILPIRAKKLLHKYAQIWLKDHGTPLSYYTQCQAEKLQTLVKSNGVVDYAFCYGSRSIAAQLSKLDQEHRFSELVVLPLYPQYSSSTTAAVFDQVSEYYRRAYYVPRINFINSFATNSDYIAALANQVREQWLLTGRSDKLMVSFHSVPVKLVESGDSYIQECQATYHLLCQELGLSIENDAVLCFQSKFGKAKWVEPATDFVIKELATNGVKSLDVICPGFVSDCLETLEEVAIQYHDLFIQCGGTKLNYIPCLNDSPNLIKVLANLSN